MFQRGNWGVKVVMWESGTSLVGVIENSLETGGKARRPPHAISNREKNNSKNTRHRIRLNILGE